MKKLFIIALCAAAIGSASAQKANVDGAKKLAGKVDKIGDARNMLKEAKANPETQTQPNTYIIAADVEYKAYDALKKNLGLADVNSEPAKVAEMDAYLLTAYPEILAAIQNASNDPKGKAEGEIQKRLAKYVQDYFQAGADFFNTKQYDKAYDAFMIYGDIPALPVMAGKVNIPDSVRATAYYNAGLSGWSVPDLPKAAKAFKAARLAGYDKPDSYIYELACWQNMMQKDSTLIAEGQQDIFDTSKAGYEKFGLGQPVFLNNMVNVLVEQNKIDEALTLLNQLISETPAPALYGLRGFVNDRKGNDKESEEDYRMAASMDGVDFETLVNAGKKIFRLGQELWNKIEGTSPDANAQRENVRTNYFEAARSIANKAQSIAPENTAGSGLDYLIENINYMLQSPR